MGAAAAAIVVGRITLKFSEFSALSPLFVGLLTAVSTSFGFLLVIATPPKRDNLFIRLHKAEGFSQSGSIDDSSSIRYSIFGGSSMVEFLGSDMTEVY